MHMYQDMLKSHFLFWLEFNMLTHWSPVKHVYAAVGGAIGSG